MLLLGEAQPHLSYLSQYALLAATSSVKKKIQFLVSNKSISLNFDQNYIKNIY